MTQSEVSMRVTMLLRLTLMVIFMVARVRSSKEIIKNFSLNFVKPLEACKKELDLPETVVTDFMNFWKEGYEFQSSLTGCALICMTAKLELLDPEMNLHHGKMKEFALKHGADDAMAQQLIDMFLSCATTTTPTAGVDHCEKAVATAMCYKAKIHALDWAPSMDLIMAEFLAQG